MKRQNSMPKSKTFNARRAPPKDETCANLTSPEEYKKRPVEGYGPYLLEGMKKPGDQPLPKLVLTKAVIKGDPSEALGATQSKSEG